MTEFEAASLILRGVVGAGQIFVVAVGVHFMRQMNKERAAQTEAQHRQVEAQTEAQRHQVEAQMEAQRHQVEAQMEAQRRQVEAQRAEADQREKRADQRHAENMEALRGLIKGMDQQGETLRAAVKGMEAVIERTAPPRNTP